MIVVGQRERHSLPSVSIGWFLADRIALRSELMTVRRSVRTASTGRIDGSHINQGRDSIQCCKCCNVGSSDLDLRL